jgi:hypothetical protein
MSVVSGVPGYQIRRLGLSASALRVCSGSQHALFSSYTAARKFLTLREVRPEKASPSAKRDAGRAHLLAVEPRKYIYYSPWILTTGGLTSARAASP